jgi:hypothetical protein
MWVPPESRVVFGWREFCAAPMELGAYGQARAIDMALLTELEPPAPRANFTLSRIFPFPHFPSP